MTCRQEYGIMVSHLYCFRTIKIVTFQNTTPTPEFAIAITVTPTLFRPISPVQMDWIVQGRTGFGVSRGLHRWGGGRGLPTVSASRVQPTPSASVNRVFRTGIMLLPIYGTTIQGGGKGTSSDPTDTIATASADTSGQRRRHNFYNVPLRTSGKCRSP